MKSNNQDFHQKQAGLRAMLLGGVALMSAFALSATAQAQDEDDFEEVIDEGEFEVITVTSKKREQSIYEVPVAVTAFSNEDLERRQVLDLVDVGKFVPNLNVTTFSAGNTSSANPFIRGIGIQDHLIVTDPGVGVYIDGVYLGRQVGQNWSLSNIERLEVLRGPQGTLFGRNTIGGAINIITKKPGDEEIARFSVTAGTRGRFNGDFYGNTRITDTLAISVNGAIKRRDGVGEFLRQPNPEARVGELFDISGRIAALWEPNERWKVLLTADGNDAKNGQNPYETIVRISPDCDTQFLLLNCLGGVTNADQSSDPYDSNSGQRDLAQTTNSAYGINLTTEYVATENLTAKMIASYRYSEYEGGLDDDGAFIDFYSFPENGNATQYSFELQLNGEFNLFDFVTGLYYFTEEGSNVQNPVTFIGPGGFFEQRQDTESFAIFGNVGFNVTDYLRVAGGLRYTWDEKDAFTNLGFVPPFSASDDWAELTWEANATYTHRDDLNFYVAVSRGYQSGGFPARPFGGEATFVSFDPVFATNYEGGVKGVPFDWLQMAATVFYTRYSDLPVQVSTLSDVGFITITENAARSRAIGVEIEGTAKVPYVDGLYINTAIGYINSEFTEVDGTSPSLSVGDTPALTPEVTLAIGAQYTFPIRWGGDITASGDLSYRSSMEGQPNNTASTKIDGRALLNLDVTYMSEDGSWTLGVYGKNIADKRYDNARLDVGDYTLVILSNDVSEFGARFTKAF